MASSLSHYLESVEESLRLDPSAKGEVIKELETHITDRLEELKESGLSEEEAAATCVKLLGSAKQLARQMYEAYSQGSWRQALLASMPHLLFGLAFALNWWQASIWLLFMLVLILGVALYGWGHGKPTWLFPWLGYSLLPVVVAGLFLLYLPRGWSWLAILIYIPLALRLLYTIAVQTIKRDWLYSSLMFFQVPIIIGWFIVVGHKERFAELNLERLSDFAPWIGLSFLALAATVAAFIRLRQRWLKITVLIVSGLMTLTLVVYQASSGLSLPAFWILISAMFGLFLTPALLERKIKHSRRQPKRRGGFLCQR